MADNKESADSSQSCPATSSTNNVEPASDAVPSSESQVETKDLVVEAVQNLQQGKRHMIVSDYKSAVPSFEEACRLLDSCYGAGAPECGEAYLHYGIALFELSRQEEGIMDGVVKVDNQLSDDEEECEEGENEEEEGGGEGEQQGNVDEENEAEAKPSTSSKEEEAAASASTEEKVDIDLTQPSTSKGETSTSNGVGGSGDNDEDDEADSASNIEVAWEVLSLARDIFADSEQTKENRLNLAEALQKLGEISIEWENNENAIHLLSECLEHRKEVLDPDDRLIALTYHYLGIAFSFKQDIDKANSCFENALSVIQLRINNLKGTNTDNMDQFEKDAIEREIKQLEDLTPELVAKIEDMKEQMQSQYKTLESLQKESEQEEEEIKQVKVTQDKPINNISHLIKRKKEASDVENGVAENGSNGDSVSNKKARVDANNGSAPDSKPTEAN